MSELTKDEIAFYREHPEMVTAVGDKTTIHRVILAIVFAAGFLMVVLSKVLKFALVGSSPWLIELTVDLIFEFGIALWGGVATTVLLQDLMQRQYREGQRYQQAIIQQLSETNHDQSHS